MHSSVQNLQDQVCFWKAREIEKSTDDGWLQKIEGAED